MNGRIGRVCLLVAANIGLLLVLFALLEAGARIHRDGFKGAFRNTSSQAPYSNLGTGAWVISDPELGYRLNPAGPAINSLSIRGDEIAIPKPQGLYRIVVLGDSVTYDRNGFVTQIRDQLKLQGPYEVINAGVPGYTAFQELEFFKRHVAQTNPDLVVWVYCLNDNHKFLHQFDDKGKMLLTEAARQSLKINTWWDVVVSRSYVLSSIRLGMLAKSAQSAGQTGKSPFAWEEQEDFNVAWKDHTWPAYEGYLKEMLALLNERQAKLAVVVFPYEHQLGFRHDDKNYSYAVKPQRILNGLCQKHGVRCLDFFPVFSQIYDQGRPLFRDGVHLNDEGHRVATSTINDFLAANGLLGQLPHGR